MPAPRRRAQTGPAARANTVDRATINKVSDPLANLRARINVLDEEIVGRLNERAGLVVEIGKRKQAAGQATYAPDREADVLARARLANHGPLPDRAIETIFRELMSASFALQRPLRVGFLGPEGSFSHVAATLHFGHAVGFENLREIAGVFTEVARAHVEYGLVPIENSTGGTVAETLDAFLQLSSGLRICAEVKLAVRHNLLTNVQPREVTRIYSRPEAFTQCRQWLATQYPHAACIPMASTAAAAQTAAQEGAAAIGSTLAGQLYGLATLFESIEDRPDNVTRFVVLARQAVPRTGHDKTSLLFRTRHAPGALVKVLSAFASHRVNLSHIDKRPSGQENWEYVFFVDAEGHEEDRALADAIEDARTHCLELRVLGSYPQAHGIL